MAQWTVTVAHVYTVEVTADTEDDAREVAKKAAFATFPTMDGQRILGIARHEEKAS